MVSKRSRGNVLPSKTIKMATACGNLYVTIAYSEGEIFEIFAHLGKAGGCAYAQLQALTRSITLGIRYNIPVSEYVSQLEKISCPGPAVDGKEINSSCPDALSKALKECLDTNSKTGEQDDKSKG